MPRRTEPPRFPPAPTLFTSLITLFTFILDGRLLLSVGTGFLAGRFEGLATVSTGDGTSRIRTGCARLPVTLLGHGISTLPGSNKQTRIAGLGTTMEPFQDMLPAAWDSAQAGAGNFGLYSITRHWRCSAFGCCTLWETLQGLPATRGDPA